VSEHADTVVFIPALNEEESLPSVLDELHEELPEVDVLVVDDGSQDGTAELARAAGADVLSFPVNRGLPVVVAAGYEYAARKHYAFCGRVDADGQHPARELRRLLERVRSGQCDVAVGSRFVSGEGYEPYRYKPSPARRLGTGLLRRTLSVRLGRPFGDATSGMYAAAASAFPFLAQPYTTGAPEVQGLLRLAEAGLSVEEVPVNMRPRLSGESRISGKKAASLVLTVTGTILLYRWMRRGSA
jgi:glycosyltransferase involved in cell wall biosynthesis